MNHIQKKMKNFYTILSITFLIMSCSKNDAINEIMEEEEEVVNLPPNNFKINISNLTSDNATINWTDAIDPENSAVTYNIYLNQALVAENIVELSYQFIDLEELTEYSGRIIAKDNNNNETVVTFSFQTKKYYLKFLKEYYYEDSINRSVGIPTDMIKTIDGGYLVIGISTDDDGASNQPFALKIDSKGNEVWKYFYGYDINGLFPFYKASQLNDGGFIITSSHFIMKIDSLGNEIWYTINDSYVNQDYDSLVTYGEMQSAKEDSQGNIFVIGWRSSPEFGNEIAHFGVLTKLDSNGQIKWEKQFPNSYRGSFDDLTIDTNDNIIILGTIETSGVTQEEINQKGSAAEEIDACVLKTDNNGEIIWEKIIYAPGYAFSSKIIATKDNNYVIVGYNSGAYDIETGAIYKITSDGDEMWRNGIILSSVLSVSETYDGGFITIGHINDEFDILGISKLSSNGTEQWTKSYQQTHTHLRGKSIFETEDNGFIFCTSFGKNYYAGDDRAKILIYKTDPEGNYEY
ncbi:hypothetical protein RBH94_13545 [Aestuariibaculum sp. YM273]|uniref:hypothetical protein n=1 Tax=Aestuariibaculum sp. YM273 TaxID=3070659 RepID=UPI0027DD20CD|nr:hypothetical protein [Aestuariibaculum sp. YM273]WMI65077.1 hypothetical protein RBH94_13545 [Aestuariibaculum sp. YM273]